MAKERIGGEIKAMLREGAKDLHNQIVPAFPQSMRGVDEPGTPLNPTQHMVTSDLKVGYEQMLSGYAKQPPQQENTRGIER